MFFFDLLLIRISAKLKIDVNQPSLFLVIGNFAIILLTFLSSLNQDICKIFLTQKDCFSQKKIQISQ